jgi:predicted metal-dependent enzyme (double-stranded beta helix superfamily)
MWDVDRFIADCRAGLSDPTPERAIKEVLERAVSTPTAVAAAFGTPREGEIAVLHHSPELTIIRVVWVPAMIAPPHDHRMWAAIGLYGGREDNAFYRRGPDGLVAAGGKQLLASDAALLGKSVIHSVTNPLREFAAAIHIYGGDFFRTPRSEWDGAQERPFNGERAMRIMAEANERWRAERLGRPSAEGTR